MTVQRTLSRACSGHPVRCEPHHGSPTPNFPSYMSTAAAIGMAFTLVLSHLFRREAARFQGWAQEFGESRSGAGVHDLSGAKRV